MPDFTAYLADIQEISTSGFTFSNRLFELKRVMERLSRELTSDEPVQFPTLFAIGISGSAPGPERLEWQLQHLRVRSREVRESNSELTEAEYRQHEQALVTFLKQLSGETTGWDQEPIPAPEPAGSDQTLRVQLLSIDREKGEMLTLPKGIRD